MIPKLFIYATFHFKIVYFTYIVLVKSLDTLLFLMFLKEVAYDHLVCIYWSEIQKELILWNLKLKKLKNK